MRVPTLVAAVVLTATRLPAQTAAAAPDDSLRLTLDQGIAIGLRQATTVQLAQENQRVAAARALAAYGRFLPAVSTGVGTYTETGNALLSQTALTPYDARFYGASIGLSTGLTLFDGLANRAALRAAIARRTEAGLTLDRAREEITFDVVEAYYRVALDDRLVAVARGNLALSRQRLAQLTEQVHAGLKAPPDLYRQQAQTREDEAAVIAAETRGSADRIGLLRRLRIDPTRKVAITAAVGDTAAPVVAPAPGGDALDVARLSTTALRARPDLAAAHAERRAAEAGITQARGARLPRVGVEFDLVDAARVFGRFQQGETDLLTTPAGLAQRGLGSQLGHQMAGVVSLGISLPLFDQWQTRAEVERAQAVAERSRLEEEDLRDRVVGDVAQAVDEIHSADQTLVAATAQVAAAQKAFDAVSGRYDVGMASFVDVATAQTALARARAGREQALVEQALARRRLIVAVGQGSGDSAAPGR